MTVSVPVMKGCTVQKYGYSPASIAVVSIVPDAPAIMRLVSNAWPASSGPLPLVAVCGALSLFTTVTVSPYVTDSSVGA